MGKMVKRIRFHQIIITHAKVFTTPSSHFILIESGEAGLELSHLWMPNTALQLEKIEHKMMMFGGMTDNGDGDWNGDWEDGEKYSLSSDHKNPCQRFHHFHS